MSDNFIASFCSSISFNFELGLSDVITSIISVSLKLSFFCPVKVFTVLLGNSKTFSGFLSPLVWYSKNNEYFLIATFALSRSIPNFSIHFPNNPFPLFEKI